MIRRAWLGLTLFAAAALAIVALAGLRSGYAEEEPLSIVVVVKATSPQMEFWQVVRQGIETAAQDQLVTTEVVGPWLEQQVSEQIDILGRVIASRPDGIILAASDFNRLAEPVRVATEAGIPIVTVDSDVDSTRIISFVGTNNIEAGRKAGREMVSIVGNGATVAIVSHIPGVATAIERAAGALEALQDATGVEILGPFYALNDEVRAEQIVSDLLQDGVTLDGIIALNETSTVGVGRALVKLGVHESIEVVGFDASTEEVSMLERGIVDALVVQKPFNMGYLSLETLARAIRGADVAPRVDTGSEVVRRSNMYDERIQRLIFPLVR